MEENPQKQTKDLNNITYSEILLQNKKYLDIKLHETPDFLFKTYQGNHQRERIVELMIKYLNEPVYTYMYFLDLFPDCTILCYDKNKKK